jgi:tetratricopeptide (TPR) repeat protein
MTPRPAPSGSGHSTSIFNVPHPRNPHFTGRDRLLDSLHQSLTAEDPSTRVQAVYGMGGVGKSHLALEYAHRYRDAYELVWWVPAEDAATASAHLAKLANRLGIRTPGEVSPEAVREALHHELNQRSKWLIVFDNASGPEDLAALLPPRNGSVLITSRNPNWGSLAHSFCLRVLERNDSIAFLQKRTGLSNRDGSAGKLAQALGDLPLALEQAGATIEQTRINFSDYLTRYEGHWAELLRSGRTPGDYPDTLAMTWELAFREVSRDMPVASALLHLCSFLAPLEIPRSLLIETAHSLPRPLSSTVGDPVPLDAVVARLHRYSLIEANEKTISLHRLVAALVRDRLPQQQQENWCDVALRMLQGSFDYVANSAESWGKCAALLPHAMTVARHAEAMGISSEVVAKLLNEVGQYLHHIGRFREARGVLERALSQHEKAYGDENPRRAAIVNNLGRVLRRLGHLDEARTHFEAALAVDQAAYGDTHAHVAEIVNNYGTCMHIAGEIEQARDQFEWALAVCEMHYGSDHPSVATVMNNLGYAHAGLGDVDKAIDHFTRSLAVAEATSGPGHPTVASIRTNLGLSLRLKGHHEEARRQFERALDIAHAALGASHPDTARAMTYLGLQLQDAGEYSRAKQLLERALEIDERVLGPDHLYLITRLNYLGRCLKKMGDNEGARLCFDRAGAILRHMRSTSEAGARGDEASSSDTKFVLAAPSV